MMNPPPLKTHTGTDNLLDGLHLYLNPFAASPLDPVDFAGREVAVHTFDPSCGTYLPDVPHGFLFGRTCLRVRGSDDPIEPSTDSLGSPEVDYPVPEVFPEGDPVAVEGWAATFRDNHLAHWRGWTILVVRDSVDDDWGWQAAEGSYRSLHEFTHANSDPTIAFAIGERWFPSRDAALADAKARLQA